LIEKDERVVSKVSEKIFVSNTGTGAVTPLFSSRSERDVTSILVEAFCADSSIAASAIQRRWLSLSAIGDGSTFSLLELFRLAAMQL
jgi:hypothetical protein